MNQALPRIDDHEQYIYGPDPDGGFGALETAAGVLPLQAMDIGARITGLSCTQTVSQTFVNAFDNPLEATYIFPLPSRAAVTRFRLKVADRVIEGELKERQQARREYEQAIQDGHRAALAEEDRPSVFSMQVGNTMPGEAAHVELELSGPLTYFDGEAEFRFPFVVAPRYIPGIALDGASVGDGVAVDTNVVPDASRISPPVLLPGFPNPVQLSLEVKLDGGGLPVSDIRSSLHAISKQEDDSGTWTIALYPGERLNRDFILRFNVAADTIRTNLAVVPDEDGSEGTFQLTLVPPAGAAEITPKRDVVFILDRSGSMGGWKMVCARRALGRMVDTLTDRDRFAVLAFDTVVELPPGRDARRLQPATNRDRFRTVEWLGQVDARGGTEMAEPLNAAVKMLEPDGTDTDKIIVLVTDGQVGNEDHILKQLGKKVEQIRIFTLGIDRAVNEGFLQRLATAGGGHCELIESEDRLDEVMDRTHRRIATPVLTDLVIKIRGATLQPDSITPLRSPDLFAGTPAVIAGRYRSREDDITIDVAAKHNSETWTATVTGQESANTAISHIWARNRIRDMEDLMVSGCAGEDLEDAITGTSLRFGVLCRYTAFVAVDKSQTITADGKPIGVTQAVEPAEGWDMLQEAECTLSQSRMATMAATFKGKPPCSAPPEAFIREGKRARVRGGRSLRLRSGSPARECPKRNGGLISNLLGAIFDHDADDQVEAPEAPQPSMPLEDTLKRLAEIIEDLHQALEQGTDSLAQALFDHRTELRLLSQALRGHDSTDVADVLDGITQQLDGSPPDAAATVKLWEQLERLQTRLPKS